jgi:hypothetical protein
MVNEDLFIEFPRWGFEFIRVCALSREAKCYCPVVNNVTQKFGRSVISAGGDFMKKLIVGNPEVCGYSSLRLFLRVSVSYFLARPFGGWFRRHLLTPNSAGYCFLRRDRASYSANVVPKRDAR